MPDGYQYSGCDNNAHDPLIIHSKSRICAYLGLVKYVPFQFLNFLVDNPIFHLSYHLRGRVYPQRYDLWKKMPKLWKIKCPQLWKILYRLQWVVFNSKSISCYITTAGSDTVFGGETIRAAFGYANIDVGVNLARQRRHLLGSLQTGYGGRENE